MSLEQDIWEKQRLKELLEKQKKEEKEKTVSENTDKELLYEILQILKEINSKLSRLENYTM